MPQEQEREEHGPMWVSADAHRQEIELMQMQIDDLKQFQADPLSSITQSIIDQLAHRDAMGRRKYHASLDRKDLSFAAWAEHAKQESLDHACYAERVRRAAVLLEEAVAMVRIIANEHDWDYAKKWLARYDSQFNTSPDAS